MWCNTTPICSHYTCWNSEIIHETRNDSASISPFRCNLFDLIKKYVAVRIDLPSKREEKRRGNIKRREWQRSFAKTGGRALTNWNWAKVLSLKREAGHLSTTGCFLKVPQWWHTITLLSFSIRYDFKPTSIDQEGLGTLEVTQLYSIQN